MGCSNSLNVQNMYLNSMVDTVGSPMGLYLKLASVSSNIGLASHINIMYLNYIGNISPASKSDLFGTSPIPLLFSVT